MLNVQDPADDRPSRREGRLAALDGLRLVAALMVVSYHYVGTSRTHLWERPNNQLFTHLYGLATYGFLGVQLFFLISGFVICMSSWGRRLRDFVVSRIVRLFPMYWTAIALSFTVVYLNKDLSDSLGVIFRPRSLAEVLANLTMTQDALGASNVDQVYWTLWVELRFYLLFSIVVWMGVTYKRVLGFCALWMIAVIVTGQLQIRLVDAIVQPASAPYFIIGILLFLIHRFGSTPVLWGFIALCLLVAQFRLLLDVRWTSTYISHGLKWTYAMVIVGGFFVLVAATALGWLDWARWRWLTVAGALTYPMYLLHQDIGIIFIRSMKGTMAPWPLLFATVGGLLVLSYLGHRLVERPVAPWLKRTLNRSFDTMAQHERRDTEEREARRLTAAPKPEPVDPEPTNGHHTVTAEAVARS